MRVTFVAHEFGIFPGHGGIASYLWQIVRCILAQCPLHTVDVICEAHGDVGELQAAYPGRFHLHELDMRGSTLRGMLRTREFLRLIGPDVVEAADYLGLAKLAALDKQLGLGFQPTVFVADHHTASQEVYEWCNELDSSVGSVDLKRTIMHERDQMVLVDANIAPSRFLARYAEKRYGLPAPLAVFPYPYSVPLPRRAEIRRDHAFHDPQQGARKFTIVLVSRFEPRKNQARLVREFVHFLRMLHAQGESLEGIELHMAGNSVPMEIGGQDYRRHVHGLVPRELSKHVHFYDFLRLEEQAPLIAMADVAVMPSTFENFPVAMIETVLRDIPVMGSRFSGVADYSWQYSEVLTFDPFVAGDLARNIFTFYRMNEETRGELLRSQQAELHRLVAAENSVFRRLRYFQSLQAAAAAEEAEGPTAPGRFVLDTSAAGARAMAGIDHAMACGAFLDRCRQEGGESRHVSLCLLSGPVCSPRVQAAVAAGGLRKLADCAVGFTRDGHYADVLDVLMGGFPLWLPFVPLEELAGHEPGRPLFEALIAMAMRRRLLIDPTGAAKRGKPLKKHTEYCFFKKHHVLHKLASEAA